MNTWHSTAYFLEGWKWELADRQEFVQYWTISVDIWVKTLPCYKNKSVGISTGGLTGHGFGTLILILPEIHGSLVPGYAQFGINLLTAHTFGCVKVWMLESCVSTTQTLQWPCKNIAHPLMIFLAGEKPELGTPPLHHSLLLFSLWILLAVNVSDFHLAGQLRDQPDSEACQ